MTTPQERRRYTRIEFEGNAHLSVAGIQHAVHLLDISLNGALIATLQKLALAQKDTAVLIITLSDDVEIQMQVHLAHEHGEVLGLQCDSIDMESMTHLRRLIELNLQDPNACERVLDELLHH